MNARLRAYRLPFKSWDDQSDKLLPREWPLKWLHVPTGFLIKDRGEMTRKRLGLTGRAGAFLTTDLEWWSIVRIPEDWAEVVTAGQVGTPLAISSTTTKGAEPMKRRKRTVFALIGLPHTWEPPPGEWKASQRAKKAGRVFHPTPPGYTIAGFAEHMHARIWSKRERRKMVRWKAHVKQYEASYNHRFKVSITFEPVELIGYAVRMWL